VNRIVGVVVSVLTSSTVDRWLLPRSPQTKYYNTGICCFSDKQVVLRSMCKDLLPLIQGNVSEWSNKSNHELLFQ
jgi:hypothetical protein